MAEVTAPLPTDLKPTRAVPYGWVLVGVLSITETVSYGVLYYAFTVFIAPMSAELGWTKTEITGAFSLALLVAGLVAPFVGRWADKRGTRGLMTVGSVLATGVLLAWSGVRSLPAFYALNVILGVATALVFYEPAFVVVANWFRAGRAQALTTMTFVAGFASIVFTPLAGALVAAHGWRLALLILAGLLGAITIPLHALFLRDHNTHASSPRATQTAQIVIERSVTTAEAFRNGAFWWLTLSFAVTAAVINGLFIHMVPLLSAFGLSATAAAGAVGLIGVMALPGRVIFTPLGARLSRYKIAAAIFACQAAGLAALLVAGDMRVWLFIALFGLGFGAVTPARAALLAEIYGPAYYGRISGRMALVTTFFRALAPVGMGALSGAVGYGWVVGLLAALSVVAAVGVLLARRPAGRLG